MDQDAIRAIDSRSELGEVLMTGNLENLDDVFRPVIEVTGKDIARQRERLGGDWAVAFAVYSRSQREALHKIFGSDLVFIVLNLTKECQMKRVKGRHGDGEQMEEVNDMFVKLNDLYKPADDDEKNAFNIFVTEDMTPEDVVQKTIAIIQNI